MRIFDGQRVVFLGDSITEHRVAVSDCMESQSEDLPPVGAQVRVDRHERRGWAARLAQRICIAYPQRRIQYHNAGVAGDSSRCMLARFEADVIAQKPQWLFLSAGVCDVRRCFQPDRQNDAVSIEEYIANLTSMTGRARQLGAEVVLLEPTPHARPVAGAPPEVTLHDVHARTRTYAAAMRQVAHDHNVGFVELFDELLNLEQKLAGYSSIYADEVHLNETGDLLYSELVFNYLINRADRA